MKRQMLFLQAGLLFFALLVGLFGFYLMAIPMALSFREYAVHFIHSSDTFLTTLGVLIVIIVFLLLVASYATTKGVSFTVVMAEKGTCVVEERVLNKLLQNYFKNIFKTFDVEGLFVDDHIEIILEMPAMPFIEQRPLLEKIEEELKDLFEQQLNYTAPFSLQATIIGE